MVGCFEGAAALGIASWGGHKFRSYRQRLKKERLAIVRKLFQHILNRPLEPSRPRAKAGVPSLGADTSAVAALTAIQTWQDSRDAAEATSVASMLPTFSVGIFKASCTTCGGSEAVADAETVICEDLKIWLLSAAGGAVGPDDVTARLEFCRQLLMRPETFADKSFIELMACVSRHLDKVAERSAGAVRTCALELTRIINLGRQVVDLSVPVLVVALTNALDAGQLPHLTAATLAVSAASVDSGVCAPESSRVFLPFWHTDAGSLVSELLSTPHFRELWGLDNDQHFGGGGCRRPSGADCLVRERVLSVKHGDHCTGTLGWLDRIDSGGSLEGSGLCEWFRGSGSSRLLDEFYLDLFEQIDDLIKFMSMLAVYKRLANIAGDAAVYRLRAGVHHLLEELEGRLVQVRRKAARVADEAKHAAAELSSQRSRPSDRVVAWIDRLQYIDDLAMDLAFQRMMESIRELSYLSSAARQPELQRSCELSIMQLLDTIDSPAFRARCIQAPPPAAEMFQITSGGFADANVSLPATIGTQSKAVLALEAPVQSLEAPPDLAWSVDRSFPCDDADFSSHSELTATKIEAQTLAGAVERLNRDMCGDAFRVVRLIVPTASLSSNVAVAFGKAAVSELPTTFVVYQKDAREAAMSALGLLDISYCGIGQAEDANDTGEITHPCSSGHVEAQVSYVVEEEPVVEEAEPVVEEASISTDSVEVVKAPNPPTNTYMEEPCGVSLNEEEDYYDKLFYSVLPIYGDSYAMDHDVLSRDQAAAFLKTAHHVDAAQVHQILDQELGGRRSSSVVTVSVLRQLGRHIAVAQASAASNEVTVNAQGATLTQALPSFEGFLWDGKRVRRTG
eukprot:TRINITY_DN18100_c0_g2_i1.p1 TRINITY_DN18100_c0_g2~~TRINITY_DN18100_c0_g2_i1.p1  ORF type:complete len:850 (-),score=127.03 TRINITY_DN18100_c0_g2_i1:46-2595(-)